MTLSQPLFRLPQPKSYDVSSLLKTFILFLSIFERKIRTDFERIVKINNFINKLSLIFLNFNSIPKIEIRMKNFTTLELQYSFNQTNHPIQHFSPSVIQNKTSVIVIGLSSWINDKFRQPFFDLHPKRKTLVSPIIFINPINIVLSYTFERISIK